MSDKHTDIEISVLGLKIKIHQVKDSLYKPTLFFLLLFCLLYLIIFANINIAAIGWLLKKASWLKDFSKIVHA